MELENMEPEQQIEITDFVTDLNEKLETAVQDSTQHAFNFGCSLSVIPLLVLVILVLFLTRFNWILTVGAAAMSLLLALGLAAWVAFTARKNSSEQTYRLHIAPEIERNLKTLQLTRPEFDRLAGRILPSEAPLQKYLANPALDRAPDTDSQQVKP